MNRRDRQRGQALTLVLVAALLVLAGGGVVFGVGLAYAGKAQAQAGADLTAIGVGRLIRRDAIPMASARTPAARARRLRRLRVAAGRIAAANDVVLGSVTFVDEDAWPPSVVRVRVDVRGPLGTRIPASAQAQVLPGIGSVTDLAVAGGGSGYDGPLTFRQGKPMCPAVGAAFDAMSASAAAGGVRLTITSAFRTDAEQAVLWARHPDPRWVAPSGRSRHRNATELDIAGTPGAWPWLAVHARRFGFVQRYSWEPWHYGYLPGCGAGTPVEPGGRSAGEALPDWVPARYRRTIVESARAGGVPPLVLAALLRVESGFDPRAVSPAGARGIAQFMPATARGMGLGDPFDPEAAIMAAGRMLGRDLRVFGSIPLALAAYNAGSGAVRRFGGVPPFAETRAYVTKIMAIIGDPSLTAVGGGGGVVLTRIEDLLV